ncbi:hypothetical protein [Haliangium sp.]|uniref:hypothetical protein n=1 Tax=Haliangium sp. TaxID=2663208 RepID=UPI003D0D3FBA
MNTRSPLAWLAVTAVSALGAAGCQSLDTSRTSVDEGSFGTTLVTLVCKRMAYLDELEAGGATVDVRGDRFRAACRGQAPTPAEAPPQLAALLAQRTEMADAIDAMWPESLLDDLQAYATSAPFLAAYDDGTTTRGVEALRDMLLDLAPRTEVAAVFERLSVRDGYTPDSNGALASVLSAPQLRDLLLHTSAEIAPGGGAHAALLAAAAGAAIELRNLEVPADPADPNLFGNLATDLLLRERDELGTGTPSYVVTRDRRGVAVVEPLAGGTMPPPFADTDADGLADVDELGRFVDASGALAAVPTPFPTDDPDPTGTRRDEFGRVIEDETSFAPLYRYIDLDRTLLGNLSRDASALLDPNRGTAIDLLRGLAPLLGPRAEVTRDYDNGESITFQGFDTTQAPLLDLTHAGLQVLRDPEIADTLDWVEVLLRDHPEAPAQLAEAVVSALRTPDMLGDLGERAELEADSALLDDLVPVLTQILETPGLLEDLMVALEDPRVAELGAYFRDYMKYADQFGYDASAPGQPVVYLDTGLPADGFRTEVNRDGPNSGFNRSIFQRVLHLLADTNGVKLCNKQGAMFVFDDDGQIITPPYDDCDPDTPPETGRDALIQIDNLAVFYVQALTFARDANGDFFTRLHDADDSVDFGFCDNSDTGTNSGEFVRKARLTFNWQSTTFETLSSDEALQLLSGINGFGNCPTPQALNRVLFLDPRPASLAGVFDSVLNRHGQSIEDLHKGTLPAWELGELFDLIQPLAQPFADHDAEQLFVDLLVVLHNHWPARNSPDHQQADPDGPGYAYASDLASFEPILVDVFDRGALLGALVENAPTLNAVTTGGKSTADILRGAGRFVLTALPELTTRQGAATITRPNGVEVTELAPWHLLAQSVTAVLDGIDASGARGEDFGDAVWNAVDVFARAEPNPDFDPNAPPDQQVPRWRFVNPRVRGAILIMLDFLRERLAVYDADGTRDQWLSQDLPDDLEELLAGPMVGGASDLVDALNDNPDARQALEGMLHYSLDAGRDPEAFQTMVQTTADLAQLALRDHDDVVTVGQAAGDLIEPSQGWLVPLLTLAGAVGPVDSEGVLAQTVRNMFTEQASGRLPISVLIDGIGEVHRARPFEDFEQRFTPADYEAFFRGIAGFIDDEKRGLRKFIAIIQSRDLPAAE